MSETSYIAFLQQIFWNKKSCKGQPRPAQTRKHSALRKHFESMLLTMLFGIRETFKVSVSSVFPKLNVSSFASSRNICLRRSLCLESKNVFEIFQKYLSVPVRNFVYAKMFPRFTGLYSKSKLQAASTCRPCGIRNHRAATLSR